MKKQLLKLFEILNLEIEINGFVDPDTGRPLVEGILNQNISYGIKFNIKTAAKNLLDIKKEILSIQDELINKYGDTDEKGLIGINKNIENEEGNLIPNPKFIEFQKEWNDFLNNNTREIEFPILYLQDLQSIRTKDNYRVIDQYFLSE